MATFSTNQVRQLYVAKSTGTVNGNSTVGTIQVKKDAAGTHAYFKYMGAGGQTRSDLIDLKNITYAKSTDANSLAHALKKYKVTLDSNVNSGAPIAGQDYILRIAFRNYIGLSEEDQYFKYGTVHAVTGMTDDQFYEILYSSLIKNFSRENSKLLNFSLDGTKATVTMTTNAGITVTAVNNGISGNNLKFAVASITATTPGIAISVANGVTTISASLSGTAKTIADLAALVAADPVASKLVTITGTAATAVLLEATAVALATGTATGVIIEEAEQPWYLGTMPLEFMNFTVMPTTVYDGTEERIWGVVAEQSSTSKVENGKVIADMEYFYMGERGDQYRKIGWPNVINTTYLVDPTVKYNVIDIYYAYQGSTEDIQKSDKYITLVVPKVGATNSVSNVLTNTIIGNINTALGLSIATLGVEA